MKEQGPLYFILSVILWVFFGCSEKKASEIISYQSDTVSVSGELRKLYAIQMLPAYEPGAESHQISSYDTTGGNNDGFNGEYSFLRRNVDSTLVIFDVVGAGVIHRFWTPTPNTDTLDFYIDNHNVVTFSIRYLDLFSGDVYPFVEPLCGNQIGGYFCYFPIPFQTSCKIVSRGKKMQFHQIQYKLFQDAAKVKSFSMGLNDDENEALKQVKNLWNQPIKDVSNFYTIDELKTTSGAITLTSGNGQTIFQLNKGGRIAGIELSPASAFEGIEKQVDIKITWDKEDQPAVYLPVHDFFGYAFGNQSMQSLLLGSQYNKNYCYFAMPFDEQAQIELIYRKPTENQTPLNIDYTIYYSEQVRDKEKEGKFYTDWNRDINPATGKPHYFINRNGNGHYVGTILQAQGLKAGMTLFFEGDDVTSVDGQQIIHGTGSEDYFNGGWYAFIDTWDTKMSLPIHGALDYSLPMCRTGGYRLCLADKIPFTKNITSSIEHGPVGNAFPVDYTSVALYYCDSPVNIQQQPTNELTKVYMPDTLIVYPQLMSYDVWDKIGFEPSWSYNTGGLSYTYTVNDESRLRISLTDIPQSSYKLFMDFKAFNEGCDFSIWQRQTQISSWISTTSKMDSRVEELFICDLDIRDFKNTLTIRFKTDENHKKLFLNRLVLVKNKS